MKKGAKVDQKESEKVIDTTNRVLDKISEYDDNLAIS